MIITFPHIGRMNIPIKALFEGLGHQVLVPPPTTKNTLALGTKYSPEGVCLPFKITLGNLIEGLEKGADTIVTCGGKGPCRLGLYSDVQKKILKDLGYKFDIIRLDFDYYSIKNDLTKILPLSRPHKIFNAIQTAWAKMQAIDYIENKVCEVLPLVVDKLKVDFLCKSAFESIDCTDNRFEIESIAKWFDKELMLLEHIDAKTLSVGIIGEIYVNTEPFANQNLISILGRMGVRVYNTLTLKKYILTHLIKRKSAVNYYNYIVRQASQYLGHYVGGHGIASIGQYIALSKQGFDGVVHIYPFGCMPEVVVKNIFSRAVRDYKTPLISLAFDEQTGIAGVVTRLEAFVDLLRFNRS